jgi:hypothetical protein
MRFTSVIVLGATVVVMAAGCKRLAERARDKAEEKAIEQQTGGQVKLDTEKGTMRIVTDAGAVSVGAGSKVPDDFPKSVPIYPGSTVAFSATTSETGKEAWTVSLETHDSKEAVAAYYKSNLGGFTLASNMELGTSIMQVWQSPKYDATLIMATEADGKTSITVSATKK